MVVFAANVADETVSLIDKILKSEEWVKFSFHTKLNLSDKTILIRLALHTILENFADRSALASHIFESYVLPYLRTGSVAEKSSITRELESFSFTLHAADAGNRLLSALSYFGEGINQQSIVWFDSGRVAVRIKIFQQRKNQPPIDGPHDVTITNPDGKSGTGVGCFTVN